jgi:hypothetical protein
MHFVHSRACSHYTAPDPITNEFSAMVRSPAQLPNTFSPARTLTHRSVWAPCTPAVICWLCLAPGASSLAADSNMQVQADYTRASSSASSVQVQCLPDDGAYLRARLSGAIDAELSWVDHDMTCTGSVRPNREGFRLRFAAAGDSQAHLVLLFGIAGLKEGESGKALPVNLTIIREGSGEFYGTQGDNKCTIDEIRQEPLQGVPLRQRAYRVIARGFCTQPARALNGKGSILVTRFDFAGRADFVSDDDSNVSSSATQPAT